MSTFEIGLLDSSYKATDALEISYPNDTYNFKLSDSGSLKLSFLGITNPVDWQFQDRLGKVIQNGSLNSTNLEAINLYNVAAGDYSFQISQTNGDTNYTLNVDPITSLNVESGFFTVGQTGQVGVDYLTDGGWYQGELAIFSLTGIESFSPGSQAFIKEAARRSLSNSTEGYVAIADAMEGAKFSPTFPWGDNYNSGEYKNVKTFAMKPGDKFGFMLVPNGSIQEVFNNPNLGGAKRPLFSLVTANPNEAFHVGQIADVTGDGKTFVMEDKRVDEGSDKDYNDLVFRITGATGKAIKLNDVIAPDKDWRKTKVVEDLIAYINTPPQFLQFTTKTIYKAGETIDLTDAKVYDENGDLNKVDFWLKRKEDFGWVDINDATKDTFTVKEDWTSFNYSLKNVAAGSYELKAIAFDSTQQSNEVVKEFRVNAAPKELQFNISQDTYNIGEIVSITGGTVYDTDGMGDLVKVDFFLKKDNDIWEHITTDVTSFTAGSGDNNFANFSHSLSPDLLKETDSYEIKAVAYDIAGDSSNEVIKNFTVYSKTVEIPPNSPPEQLQFNLLPSYTIGQSVSIGDAKVYDKNGESGLQKVDLEFYKDNIFWDKYTVDITDDSKSGDGWGTFNYSRSDLPYGNYRLEAIASNKSGGVSNKAIQSFNVVGKPTTPPITNLPPQQLQLNLLPTYKIGEPIVFPNAKVYDGNGASDLDKITLELYKDDKKLGDYTVGLVGIADNWGTFNISFCQLELGNYRIKAKAYDKSGATDEDTAEFKVVSLLNKAPEDLRFSILPLYTNKETISFNGAKVFDADGRNDLERIDFKLKLSDGTDFLDIPDVTQFTTDNQGNARFDFSHDLNNLAPGRYQLWAIAQDKAGSYSNPEIENFSVITDPGEGGLSDEIRLAIANSAKIQNYTPEELAKAKSWVVGVTPGQSSQNLAAAIGAYDWGASGQLPNTYIWEFPQNVTPTQVSGQLNALNGVEFAYPLIPIRLIPQSEPNDPLFANQWHLQNKQQTGGTLGADLNVIPAWNLARGKGVVIGVVDDGLQYTHPDLKNRYVRDLSRDFNETVDLDGRHAYRDKPLYKVEETNNLDGTIDTDWITINQNYAYDNDPEPTYKAIVLNNSQKDIPYGNSQYNEFLLDVPLTGVISDINVLLDITDDRAKDLAAYLNSPDGYIFNPLIGTGATRNRLPNGGTDPDDSPLTLFKNNVGINGGGFSEPIWLDDEASQSITQAIAPFSGSYKPEMLLSKFDNQYVKGKWKLKITNNNLSLLAKLNSFGLELNTYNPHGTAVAGLIAASGNNSIGGIGVAPEASLAGLRLIADEVIDLQISDALSYRNDAIQIYNNS